MSKKNHKSRVIHTDGLSQAEHFESKLSLNVKAHSKIFQAVAVIALSIISLPSYCDIDRDLLRLESRAYSDINVYPRLCGSYSNGIYFRPGLILLASKFDPAGSGMGFIGSYVDGVLKYHDELTYGPKAGIELGCAGNFSSFLAMEYGYLITPQGDLNNIAPRFGLSLGYINMFCAYNWYFDTDWKREIHPAFEFGLEINLNKKGLRYFFG